MRDRLPDQPSSIQNGTQSYVERLEPRVGMEAGREGGRGGGRVGGGGGAEGLPLLRVGQGAGTRVAWGGIMRCEAASAQASGVRQPACLVRHRVAMSC